MKEIDLKELIRVLLKKDVQNSLSLESIFNDLLSPSERAEIHNRIAIAQMLMDGVNYTHIGEVTGASSATISKVSEMVKYGHGGYRHFKNENKKT